MMVAFPTGGDLAKADYATAKLLAAKGSTPGDLKDVPMTEVYAKDASGGFPKLGINGAAVYNLHVFADSNLGIALDRGGVDTNAVYQRVKNAGGSSYFGHENSAGTGLFASGGAAYALGILTENARPLILGTNNTGRVMINASGLVLIARSDGTISGGNGANFQIGSGAGSAGATLHSSNVGTGDIQFSRGTTGTDSYRGLIRYAHSSDPNLENFSFWVAAASRAQITNSMLGPGADNAVSLGAGVYRYTQLYAVTSTINTSDAREKDWRGGLTDAELRAAKTIIKGVGVYRWLEAITEKGDDARLHVGVTAQAVVAALEAEGLDPFRYGFVCYDEWEAKSPVEATDEIPEVREPDTIIPALIDEESGEVIEAERVEPGAIIQEYVAGDLPEPGREAGNRYGVRYEELMMFIAAGLEQRLAALESA